MANHVQVENIADMRAILTYARRFRSDSFVISLAGEVLIDEGLDALLVDLALLQSLGIKLVLCLGLAGYDQEGEPITEENLAKARHEVGFLAQRLCAGFGQLSVYSCVCYPVEAIAYGKLNGVDQVCRGRVEKVDSRAIESLLAGDQVVILPPLGIDSKGEFLWLSPQRVAAACAQQLQAAKWLDLGCQTHLNYLPSVHLRTSEAESYAGQGPAHSALLLRLAARTCAAGVERVHLLDGLQSGALLAELFSPDGVGYMIHADEYGVIRPLKDSELPLLEDLLRYHMEDEFVLPRSSDELEEISKDFFVLDLDGALVGCVALHDYPAGEQKTAELAGLCIKPAHEGRGHGRRLVEELVRVAQERGIERLFALSTNARDYFTKVLGWQEATIEDLPASRRESLEKTQRNSWVFTKELQRD